MPSQVRSLILCGGPYHPFEETSKILQEHLNKSGLIRAEITDEVGVLAAPELQDYDVLVLNCLRFSQEGTHLSEAQKQGLLGFLQAGKGLVPVHSAVLNFDDWEEYGNIIGGIWVWEVTAHAPYEPGVRICIVDRSHPINAGVEDFEVYDELYHTLTIKQHVHVLMTALWGGRLQPMAWTHRYANARVYYNALGHGVETYQSPQLLRLLQQGIQWVAGAEA